MERPIRGSPNAYYCNVVNDTLTHADDKKTIGLLLVRSKNKMLVEYSLAGYGNPISVANWERTILKSLPKELAGSLPTVEEIEAEFSQTSKRGRKR